MLPLPPRYTRTDTLIPYTTLCRSQYRADLRNHGGLTQIYRVALDQHARTQGADGGDVQLAQTREHCRMGVAPVRRLPAHVLNAVADLVDDIATRAEATLQMQHGNRHPCQRGVAVGIAFPMRQPQAPATLQSGAEIGRAHV